MQANIHTPGRPGFIRKAAAKAAEAMRIRQIAETQETYRTLAERRIKAATDEILKEAARTAELTLQENGYLIEEGEISYAATPSRVYARKEDGYYEAARACVDYMASNPHMLLLPTSKLLAAMLPYVEACLELSSPLPRKQFFYGSMALPVRKDVRRMLEAQQYALPRKHHRTLKELRDFLRDNRPSGRETGNGAYQFFNGTHVRMQQGGRLLTIRDKRGIPCVRIKGIDKNLYTLLGEMGVNKETADMWMSNSRHAAPQTADRPLSNWQLSTSEIDSIDVPIESLRAQAL